MFYKEEYLREYVRLAVAAGAAVKPGQKLLLRAPVECADVARLIAGEAYAAGAGEVVVDWTDGEIERGRLLYADDNAIGEAPDWTRMYNRLSAEGAAFLLISAADPEEFKGADISRISRAEQVRDRARKPYIDRQMSNGVQWCVICVPTEKWAQKVFGGAAKAAVNRLWDAIFQAARIDGNDAVENWRGHGARLAGVAAGLNALSFKSLHYENSLGTDLTIGLADGHEWAGAGSVSGEGREFLPNIPTEEIFTAPHCGKADGRVYSTMPLAYGGNLIDGFSLTFKNGRAVGCAAEKNPELLEKLLASHRNMDRLGEAALVPVDSPISEMGVLFYNTLFDENASCHLALGRAYPSCVKGGDKMTAAERRRAGLNACGDHVDFMIGSADLRVTGLTASGKEVAVMKDGKFVI